MNVQPKSFGVSVRYKHLCGHIGNPMFYAGEEFAVADQPRQEAQACWGCHNTLEIFLAKIKEEHLRRNPSGGSFPSAPELTDPSLPRAGDFYIDATGLTAYVQRDDVGQYFLRRVPCQGVLLCTWVRDQEALADHFSRGKFHLLRRTVN